MSQPLDLCVTLLPPPHDSHPDVIACCEICCATVGLSSTGNLLTDPLTNEERNDLRWYLEEYWKWPYEQFAARGKYVERSLIDIGKRLYHAVFGSAAAKSIVKAWWSHAATKYQISIESEVPRALSLPWELLHDESGFLALRSTCTTSIVRRLPHSHKEITSIPFESPTRILLVTARPKGVGFVDPRSIARELLDKVQEQLEMGAIELEFLRPPTIKALQTRLQDRTHPVHILHFDGHGVFGEGDERKGTLAFENTDGWLDAVEARTLAQVIHESKVRLVVLTACQSAMHSVDDAFSSVAAQLIKGGIQAVIAMSTSILVATATRYVESLYHNLTVGTSISTAHSQACQSLHANPQRHLQARYRDEEGDPVELCDWWLPHLYQQHPTVLLHTQGREISKKPASISPAQRLNEEMPARPDYGFNGRAYELYQAERYLLQGKLVIIYGLGGIGKTALVRELADWLTRTGMYDRACFISFERGGDAASLLRTLGSFFGIDDNHYNPNNHTGALSRLKPLLQQQRTLVIADNLESTLPHGEAPLDTLTKGQLYDILLEIHHIGAGVLLTSRDADLGDSRLAPGKQVVCLVLGGLNPEDAYLLASQVLANLSINREQVPYVELYDMLKQLDYHPLAIRLVLPRLQTLPISKVRVDFAELLPRFIDHAAEGRNRSLLASLQYSLQGMSREQQVFLPRLALFEGGANENTFLAVTEIPSLEWSRLRRSLEQVGLLTEEHLHQAITVPFLHFHPVLTPYLQNQFGTNDEGLQERYAKYYFGLLVVLNEEDSRNPEAARVLVRRELPNLQRALRVLLEKGDLGDFFSMAMELTRFLSSFGLFRERDELRRHMATVVAQEGEMLTREKYIHEAGLAQDDWGRGNPEAAYTRLSRLLLTIEALPEDKPQGRGSYEHCATLHLLARCQRDRGKLALAEKLLHAALTITEQHTGSQIFMEQRASLLSDLGLVLSRQGRYSQAQTIFEEALRTAEQQNSRRQLAETLEHMGTLKLNQGKYVEAQHHHRIALEIYQELDEPAEEAGILHNLGVIAQEMKQWADAEHYLRQSLAIRERLGNLAHAAESCSHLGIVTEAVGRPTESEGWHMRALELDDQAHPGHFHPGHLHNFAVLLKNEVQAGRAPITRLSEARQYAERALTLKEEKQDSLSELWTTLSILAAIAGLEGRPEVAKYYHRRECASYVADRHNRYMIEQQFEAIIAAIVKATDDSSLRPQFDAMFTVLEAKNWHLAEVVQRIWKGEGDWEMLSEELRPREALVVLLVLEALNQQKRTQERDRELLAQLPPVVREALEAGGRSAFEQSLDALLPQEQQVVLEILDSLSEDALKWIVGPPNTTRIVKGFEPLLQAIAAVAVGDAGRRSEADALLHGLGTKGLRFKEAVYRIWAGERDIRALTTSLEEIDRALVQRILEIIEDG